MAPIKGDSSTTASYMMLSAAAGVACIAWGALYAWRAVEGSKSHGGANPWLHADWRSSPLFFAWAYSLLLGTTTLVSACCAYRRVLRDRATLATLWAIKAGALGALTALLGTKRWAQSWSFFFGTAGIAIAALFVLTAVLWAGSPRPHGMGSYLQLEGYALFASALWFTCGMSSSPGFALKPEMQRAAGEDATAIAHDVMLLSLAGWACTAAGMWLNGKEGTPRAAASPPAAPVKTAQQATAS